MRVHLFDLGNGHIQLCNGKKRFTLESVLFSALLLDLPLSFFDLLLALFYECVLGRAGCAEYQRHHDR